ncbi:MAG: 2-polyprenyl-3-methyl-6-methoxy,4-benzoquinol hydroxylase [Rickettsiaceae bacterium]|jgi:ubiquinone biosynthesis monooxygenase Coq7|nr:2-polyprenyl-3-methyl-6-methoxy,4-benzoquinol hydroxylase [Rickettsiaceae bacterium]
MNDLSPQEKLHQIIRVNHAGEYGAKQIYKGQLAVFKRKKDQETVDLIHHMEEQEQVHFDYFNQKIIDQKVRPTLMQPLWQVAGFALGFATAMMGKKAAMACTVAVEEVIDEHYQNQLDDLEDGELKKKIEQFRQEELEHRDIGLENHAEDLTIYKPLSFLIKKASKLAIAISTKI